MLTWPREAATPPRITAVSPGKTKPISIDASAKTSSADQRVGLPPVQVEEGIEEVGDHGASRRRAGGRARLPALSSTH